jgi:hypothetical protein
MVNVMEIISVDVIPHPRPPARVFAIPCAGLCRLDFNLPSGCSRFLVPTGCRRWTLTIPTPVRGYSRSLCPLPLLG